MTSLPAANSVLKPLGKFLQQARQLERVDLLLSYYCRMHALQVGMKIQGKSTDDKKLIAEQLAWLEKNQACVTGLSKDDGRARAEAFALQVFSIADDEDRAGAATKKTALNFHAAYVLMDVCRQFSPTGDLASDLQEKQKYAAVKAADINRAIKEGRKPKAGPLVESVDEEAAMAADLGLPPPNQSSSMSSPNAPQQSNPAFDSYSYKPPNPATATSSASAFPFMHDPSPSSLEPNPTPLPDASAYMPPPAAAAPYQPPAASAPAFNPHAASSAPPAHHSAAHGHPAAAAKAPAPHSFHSGGADSPFSPAGIAARNSGAATPASTASAAKKDTRKLDAVRESERLIKHSLSAIVFSDIDTTVMKLKEALAMLQPFSNK